MRSLSLFILTVCAASFYSCTEAEEPTSPLIGSWENRVYIDSIDYWVVQTYDFVNDSTYDIIETVRETEDGEDLGFRFVSRGWYDLQGESFTYYYSDVLMLDNYFMDSINPGNLYAPKEELKAFIIDFFREPTAKLSFSASGKEFVFLDECLEGFPECAPPRNYVKVN